MIGSELAAMAIHGWDGEETDPRPGDEERVGQGFTGFAGLVPPESLGALFPLGQVVFTPGARSALSMSGAFDHVGAVDVLERFVTGDWGPDTPPERQAENLAAVEGEGRIAASYAVGYGMIVWLVTEWDRSLTSFVGAGEYR